MLESEIEDVLVDAGMKRWIARVLAATSIRTLMAGAGDPTAQLRVTLRGLIVLVCPNLERCPALNDIRKTFLAPLIAGELRRVFSLPRMQS